MGLETQHVECQYYHTVALHSCWRIPISKISEERMYLAARIGPDCVCVFTYKLIQNVRFKSSYNFLYQRHESRY